MYRVSERRPNLRRVSAAATLIVLAPVAAPIDLDAQAASRAIAPETPLAASRPHLLDGVVADVIVRLGVCSGTPITGTVYVVTAAHCVLTDTGEVTRRAVVRDRVRYPAVAVLVDTDYSVHRSEELDVAVLIMAQVIPGPSARVGSLFPDSGQVTLAGFQPIDSDGTLLRARVPRDHAPRNGATGTRIDSASQPAGCVVSVQALELSTTRVMVPCGLVPGASGGALLTEDKGEHVLVGILSTVTTDLSANGIVPLASLHELLKHHTRYEHAFTVGHVHGDHSRSPDVSGHGEP